MFSPAGTLARRLYDAHMKHLAEQGSGNHSWPHWHVLRSSYRAPYEKAAAAFEERRLSPTAGALLEHQIREPSEEGVAREKFSVVGALEFSDGERFFKLRVDARAEDIDEAVDAVIADLRESAVPIEAILRAAEDGEATNA